MQATWWQIIRFGLVGLISNGVAYAVYLALTAAGMDPYAAATVVYVVALAVGFAGHRKVTFAHQGRLGRAAVSYLVAYAIGYLIDIALLTIGMNVLGQSHVIAQAEAVVVVAMYLYVALRLFVFTSSTEGVPAGTESALDRDGEQRASER
jgi:putative flippase GtrA